MTEPHRAVRVFAPAKINLSLHVVGQRDDGFHLLDSLVVFASVGDTLEIQSGAAGGLSVEGPEAAGVPEDADNLVLKIARLFPALGGVNCRLIKSLPAASGIGGGSADAAAAFRALQCLSGGLGPGEAPAPALFDPNGSPMARELASLGADIPVCLLSRPARMRGIGGSVERVDGLPPLFAVLVNPRVAVSTPAVFRALATKDNPPMPEAMPRFAGAGDLIGWLHEQRNDLQAPAMAAVPAIGAALRALERRPECLLARMSGSGASCFGLFGDKRAAEAAARAIAVDRPDWWVRPVRLGSMADLAMPRIS